MDERRHDSTVARRQAVVHRRRPSPNLINQVGYKKIRTHSGREIVKKCEGDHNFFKKYDGDLVRILKKCDGLPRTPKPSHLPARNTCVGTVLCIRHHVCIPHVREQSSLECPTPTNVRGMAASRQSQPRKRCALGVPICSSELLALLPACICVPTFMSRDCPD